MKYVVMFALGIMMIYELHTLFTKSGSLQNSGNERFSQKYYGEGANIDYF